MPQTPLNTYQDRRDAFAADLAAARKLSGALSNARLIVVLAALAGFFWFIFRDDLIPSLLFLGAGIVAFVALMFRHDKSLAREKRSAQLLALNEAGLDRMQGRWNRFPADGGEFSDDSHPYASDLDVFGPSSLFQWMNAAQTRLGRLGLARLLSQPPRAAALISADQDMVRELAPRLDWRQRFQAAGGSPPARQAKEDPETLMAWAEETAEIFPRPALASALRFLPLLSFAYALCIFFQYGLSALMVPPFLLHAILASRNQALHGPVLDAIRRQKDNLELYLELLRLGESAGFKGPGLAALTAGLRNPQGTAASEAVHRLQRLADHLETRLNPVLHFLVNALFLWDLQWLWVFRGWRRENGPSLRTWLDALARLEILSSLAIPACENPHWAFPEIAAGTAAAPGTGEPLVDARDMAHPLLPADTRVGNDLRLGGRGEVLIITGSNMSGKSTMMRTVGVNLVLAYAGAPVCARAFDCATLELHTSMRLKDDLEKRISSFYAELLRIKGIVEAARAGRQVLFLVDEIFRGTNSKDRHAGAMAVLRQLHALGAAGLVSTHDLELARLEEMEPSSFHNFHFQERYADGKIGFDYKMAPGVSTTTNAMHLLRMVGLGPELTESFTES
jgi:MutS-like protein